MAIVLTNGQFYIAHNKTGGIIKVTDISQAQDFHSVKRAISQKNKAPSKCASYYYIDTNIPVDDVQPTMCNSGKSKTCTKIKRKHYSTEQRKMIYKKYDGRCQLCGREIEFQFATLDHVIPLAQGGIDSLDNVQLACKCCNRQKASYLPEKFVDRITEIFMYQMEKKYSENGNWKLARNLLMEIL